MLHAHDQQKESENIVLWVVPYHETFHIYTVNIVQGSSEQTFDELGKLYVIHQ